MTSSTCPRGKKFDVDTYAEMYITDKEYMSVGQAKKFEKRDRRVEAVAIVSPDHAPELQPAIVELVGRSTVSTTPGFVLSRSPIRDMSPLSFPDMRSVRAQV